MLNLKMTNPLQTPKSQPSATPHAMTEGTKELESSQAMHPQSNLSESAEASPVSSINSEAEHFDALLTGPIAEAAGMAGAGVNPAPVNSPMVSKDTFHQLFCAAFNLTGHAAQLKSLQVPREDESAKLASGAIYDTILETPMLHFMINPQSKWLERAAAIAMFAGPMAINVKLEIQARKMATNPVQTAAAEGEKFHVPDFDMTGAGEKP